MTKYREILRLKSMGLSQQSIADSCNVSKKTGNRVLKRAKELNIFWPLDKSDTDAVLAEMFFPSTKQVRSNKRMPDYDYVHKELLRNGVSKKLLWTEYMEDCHANGEEPLMYSQFCYHIQQDEQKRRATMHINRKPGEQVEVDWAGDPATIIDPDTGEITKAYIFVGVMTYSQYAYVEAFLDTKQKSWINAHVHMYEYFGGVARILVPDNCKTAVIHNRGFKDQQINETYQEMAEYYGTAIIPARVRAPKDKPNAEGTVGNISTWITAALRDEQFFSLAELNLAIRDKLELFNQRLFQKKEGREFPLYITVDEHMPPEHLYYKEVNSKDGNYYRRWASAISPAMSELIDRLLKSSKHEEQSYNACAGILHKVKTIPKGAAEEVARKCIEINSCKYFTFKQMLKKMDVKELPEHSPGTLPNHENIRGKDYYK